MYISISIYIYIYTHIYTRIPGLHVASFVASPAILTPLAEHVLCAVHVWLVSFAALNFPSTQASHFAGLGVGAGVQFKQ